MMVEAIYEKSRSFDRLFIFEVANDYLMISIMAQRFHLLLFL